MPEVRTKRWSNRISLSVVSLANEHQQRRYVITFKEKSVGEVEFDIIVCCKILLILRLCNTELFC